MDDIHSRGRPSERHGPLYNASNGQDPWVGASFTVDSGDESDRMSSSSLHACGSTNITQLDKSEKFVFREEPKPSGSSLGKRRLEKVEEEEEEIQMILDLNSPLPTSVNLYEDSNRNENFPQEEDILHWRSLKVCHCSSCFNKLIERLPKPPKTTMEITRSQSLSSFYDNSTQANYLGLKNTATPNINFKIQTRELDSMHVVTFGDEILSFQGTVYSPKNIAATWKKDCRMWLWKSVRASNRRKLMACSLQF